MSGGESSKACSDILRSGPTISVADKRNSPPPTTMKSSGRGAFLRVGRVMAVGVIRVEKLVEYKAKRRTAQLTPG